MVGKKKYTPIEEDRNNIVSNGRNKINIDPVYIDVSIFRQIRNKYNEVKLFFDTAQSIGGLTSYQIEDVHEIVQEIIELTKCAIKEHSTKKIDKEELITILEINKKVKLIEKALDRRYMLESDTPESKERRWLLSEWSRTQDKQNDGNNRITNIDVPIFAVKHTPKGDKEDR